MARTDTLELYAHECRQDLWTVSNRERVARRAAYHLSDAGEQALGQVKVVGAVGVVVLTVLLTVRVVFHQIVLANSIQNLPFISKLTEPLFRISKIHFRTPISGKTR